MACIFAFTKFMRLFETLYLSLSLMTITVLHRVFVRSFDFLRVSLNQYPQNVLVLLYNFLFMKFIFYRLKKEDILKKAVLSLILYQY